MEELVKVLESLVAAIQRQNALTEDALKAQAEQVQRASGMEETVGSMLKKLGINGPG